MISLICPTYRNPKYLDVFLKSAVEQRVNPATEIIVIVDGFVDESRAVLDKYKGKNVDVIELPENKGMQYALNLGVMQANNPYIVILNDDNVMPSRYDERIAEELKICRAKYGDKFSMTINQIEPTGPSMFMHTIVDFGQDTESFQYDKWIAEEPTYRQPMNEHGHIFPYVLEKKYYLATGGLDTFYDSPNICDWDQALKLELLGFAFPRTYNLNLYHFGSVVTKKNAESPKFQERQQKAALVYEYKWGAQPFNQPGTNSKIIPNKRYRGFTV